MARPLDGIRILDFTRYQQGPFATVLLGDFGAEVIKVEDPGGGDFGRRMLKEPDGFSAFWEALNRGKKSITLDMRQAEDRDIALRLGESADVVVENFRPGTMDGWGLGYEAFKARNPRIIYAQATGWAPKERWRPFHPSTRSPRPTADSPSTAGAGRDIAPRCPTRASPTRAAR